MNQRKPEGPRLKNDRKSPNPSKDDNIKFTKDKKKETTKRKTLWL